jgi:phage head maturation protease
MKEDEHGLYVEGKLLIGQNVPKADEAYALLKAGALSGLSIGFVTKQHLWDDKKGVRYLKEVELWETSLVTFPANGAARITAVKSLDGLRIEEIPQRKRDIEAVLRDAGCSITVAKAIASQAGNLVAQDEQGELVEVLKKATNILIKD